MKQRKKLIEVALPLDAQGEGAVTGRERGLGGTSVGYDVREPLPRAEADS